MLLLMNFSKSNLKTILMKMRTRILILGMRNLVMILSMIWMEKESLIILEMEMRWKMKEILRILRNLVMKDTLKRKKMMDKEDKDKDKILEKVNQEEKNLL